MPANVVRRFPASFDAYLRQVDDLVAHTLAGVRLNDLARPRGELHDWYTSGVRPERAAEKLTAGDVHPDHRS
ncbi:MAG: hypothetical protein K2X82_08355 [Gemmataceae bacterium]|nr:hypothetical protein [Gemmataceae bacterium]